MFARSVYQLGEQGSANSEALLTRTGRDVLAQYTDGGTVVFSVNRASDILQTLQFAGEHLAMSLLSFNLGVEAGQLMILAILIPIMNLLFRYAVSERVGTIVQ